MVRLWVSGIPAGTTCEQLAQRFSAFGTVGGCEVVPPKMYRSLPGDAGFERGFGYVELEPTDDAALRKCMAAYNGSKWRGHVLKCQVARESYQQRLEQEWSTGAGAEQEAAQGRALPPLEPGVKLRLRHPSKPTTVEVELASGQRLAAFPPAPVHTSRSSSGAGCSWDPLPTPPGARYTFEARLRQFAARQPVQLAAALDGSEETADAASSRQRKGAAISLHYPPTSRTYSPPLGDAPAAARGRQLQRPRPPAAQGQPQPAAAEAEQQQQQQQQPPKKRKVVDFMAEEEVQQGQRAAAGLDLSRFASDSEEEGNGPEGPAPRPARQMQAAAKPLQAARPAAPQRQQAQRQPAAALAGRPLSAPVVEFVSEPAEQQQQQQQQQAAAAAADLGRFGSDSEEEGAGQPASGHAALPRVAAAPALQHPLGRQRVAAGVPEGGAMQKEGLRGDEQPAAEGMRPDLSRFASDSGEEATTAGRQPPARRTQQQHPAPPGHQAQQQQAPKAQQGAQRAVVDFLSVQDEELLRQRVRPALDLSRFGSGSDSEGAGGERPSGRPLSMRAARVIPQLDGAWDSEEEGGSPSSSAATNPTSSSSSSSEQESGSGSEVSTSSSSEKSSSSGASSGSSSGEEEGPQGAQRRPAKAKPSASEEAAATHADSAVATARPAEADSDQEGTDADQQGRGGPEGVVQPHSAAGAAESEAAAPAWMGRLLPAGTAFVRQEPLERLEAAWRVGRDGWAQDYRAKHRQALRHLSRPAGKKQRRG